MKIFIPILALVILVLGAVFLPLYKGRVINCGITGEGCFFQKLNLIQYLEYKKVLQREAESVSYTCKYDSSPIGRATFRITREADNELHLRIASKPPQTEYIMKKSVTSAGVEYKGEYLTILDSSEGVRVTWSGQVLESCEKD
jgi:hypothetical protein